MMDGEVEGHVFETGEPRSPQQERPSLTKRIFAPLLSLMMPGAGQLYNRHWVKGGFFIVIVMLFSGWLRREMIEKGATSVAGLAHSPYVVIALIVLLGFGIWSIFDAYRDASMVYKA